MIWSFPQIIGYVGFIVSITAFLQKKDISLVILNAAECLVLALHFYLLDNNTAMVILLIAASRNIVSLYVKSTRVAVFFVILGITLGIYTLKHWYSCFTILAQVVSTIALFTCKGISLRLAFCFGSTCWIINNIFTGSIGGIAVEIFVILANITTIIRLLKDHKT